MTLFESIIKINNTEDNLRINNNKANITDQMLQIIKTKDIEFVQNDFGDRIVLTGSAKLKATISDNEFNMEFSKKTFDLLTYLNWDNIVVAGGSLVNIITKSTEKLNDVDLFVYGLDREQAKLKIDHVIMSIKQKATDMKYDTRVYMNSNVINIYVFDNKKILQVQVILRLYETLAHVLVGFDVDCCCIAFNGKNLVTTNRGLNALKYRVNTANLKRRSPSYENRLIKYSFRGFDVVTDFAYKQMYNKMFFMASENYGFTRLLEQELINNGQLKNIIFSNTLRFRQTSTYTENHSFYVKEHLEIKDIRNTESCITKHNANIEDEKLKFKEYNIKNIDLMELNVMEQFTGSFNPITDENWVGLTERKNSDEAVDSLGRPISFIKLKYNAYVNIAEFENTSMKDISNFDAKCLAVMYLSNESDIIRICENKYIQKTNNMYKIGPVQLAILLGRTKLAIALMKGHNYETMKDLIYMMDNDKLFTHYCNSSGKSCTDVDKYLVGKFGCENISDSIHDQNNHTNSFDDFYKLSEFDMIVKIASDPNINTYRNIDIKKLEFGAIKMLYERGILYNLNDYLIKKFDLDEINKFTNLLSDPNERKILQYIINSFELTEGKKCINTSQNINKLLALKNLSNDKNILASLSNELNSINHNLYFCMLNISNPNLTLEIVDKLIGKSKLFDKLVDYVLYLDDVDLIQKIIPKDDLYVKLKYQYKIESHDGKIKEFFNQIDMCRQNEKIKTNKILKNTDAHTIAINDGELLENYKRCENVFGMTPEDNIISKLLLLYNKVFNKHEQMNEKDLTTLKNMRKAVQNIKRNSEYNVVNSKYFYSLNLHNLFFSKTSGTQTDNSDSINIDDNLEYESVIPFHNDPVKKSVNGAIKKNTTANKYVIDESDSENDEAYYSDHELLEVTKEHSESDDSDQTESECSECSDSDEVEPEKTGLVNFGKIESVELVEVAYDSGSD